jgi:hypothetical protein
MASSLMLSVAGRAMKILTRNPYFLATQAFEGVPNLKVLVLSLLVAALNFSASQAPSRHGFGWLVTDMQRTPHETGDVAKRDTRKPVPKISALSWANNSRDLARFLAHAPAPITPTAVRLSGLRRLKPHLFRVSATFFL